MQCKKPSDRHQNSGKKKKAPLPGQDENMRCKCGRMKYWDAIDCGQCTNGYPDNWLNR